MSNFSESFHIQVGEQRGRVRQLEVLRRNSTLGRPSEQSIGCRAFGGPLADRRGFRVVIFSSEHAPYPHSAFGCEKQTTQIPFHTSAARVPRVRPPGEIARPYTRQR